AFFSDSYLGYNSDFLKVNNVVNDMLTRLDILNFQGMSNLNRDNMSEFNNSKTYKKLIKKCLKVTHKMIKKNKNIIKKVADKLVENKVLYRKDLEEIMCGSKTEPQKLETISVNAFNNRV
ncbi:MAG: hypothetical protein LBM99_03820, partial [Bacillales bacterium]|nr:hypothetical protein [Bacillales bacterium]